MVEAVPLPVQTGVSAMDMAKELFGQGIKIVDADYKGDPQSAGIYTGADHISPGVAPADSGVILSTGHAADITNKSGEANQSSSHSSDTNGVENDAGLNSIAGTSTHDGAIFSAHFIPDGSTLTMQLTFSSEEYMEYAGSGFNDAVGVWVNGEKAQLTVGTGDVSIDNINAWTNSPLYVDNQDGHLNTEMDGLTVTLTLKAAVTAGQMNDIRIGIADGSDSVYDSNLMIAGHSIQSEVVAADDQVDLGRIDHQTVDLLANDHDASGTGLFITQINGLAVHAGSELTLSDGTSILVNGDGTITVGSDGHEVAGDHSFSYTVENGHGISDVGFVHAKIACFAAGAQIMTERGPIAVEALEAGDRIQTLDHGWQPLRWIGHRRVAGRGRFAPVLIPADMFGTHGPLRVSPQHRLLVSGWQAELLTGHEEVLVKAIHLVRAGLLRQDNSGGPVTYFHLAFDRHEIINAEGLWSESYFPAHDDPEIAAELDAILPQGPQSLARPEADGAAVRLMAAYG